MAERYYLSDQDRRDRMDSALEMMGGDTYSCGGYDPGTVCGGCPTCILRQVDWAFQKECRKASRYQAMGLEYANPNVLDWWAIVTFGGRRAEAHDWTGHVYADEPWERSAR